jgi:multiple sugar transport system substrate-binding protein
MIVMKKLSIIMIAVLLLSIVLAACQPAEVEEPVVEEPVVEEPVVEEPVVEEPEPVEEEEEVVVEEPEPVEEELDVIFFSTQFVPVEEQERFRAILQDGGFDFVGTEEGPLIDLIKAGTQVGQAELDVVGALHGTFPPIADDMMNLIDVFEDLSADREFPPAFLETGLLGTTDYLYYIPWMQATYIMAAHVDALEYLPEGVTLETMTWNQFSDWCQVMLDETGGPKCGLPHAGLFHRFMQGYLYPSFTGGMVSRFRTDAAADMLAWARDDLWPAIHPQSISYEFMQEPLLSGEVWVAFDHTARLIEAFNDQPDNFVGFPAPSGPEGQGFMPVIVGLGIPNNPPSIEAAIALIDYLTTPEVQARVLRELAFFPVVAGVDFSGLPDGVAIEAAAVEAQANHPDAIAALLPVGLGERGGEINLIFRNVFDRVVLDGEDIATVLQEEGAALEELIEATGAPCWAPDPASVGPCPIE